MGVRVITPPALEPITLEEAHAWVRDDSDPHNDFALTLLIQAMREYAENLTGRAFVPRTLELTLDSFAFCSRGAQGLLLPSPPLVSVESVTYVDVDGADRALSVDVYTVDADSDPGRIYLSYNQSWPSTRAVPGAVRVRYVAGYAPLQVGSPAVPDYRANIPACVKLWMHTRLATLFENREQIIVGDAVSELPRDFADGLLDAATSGMRFG
jgi:uncharacterized phiE125 gp8 family phage protein